MDYNECLKHLWEKVEGVRVETVTAGTKYRLMGLAADIVEVTEMLQNEVLERVTKEAVMDADATLDYGQMAEQVMTWELQSQPTDDEALLEQKRLVNEMLEELVGRLTQIADQLVRHHRDEEYARLYEEEKRRYLSSGTAQRARKKFGEWKEDHFDGAPVQEDIEDYRLEKVMRLFEKGVFKERVEHIQRAKHYVGEIDFDHLDDDHPMKKTVNKHYTALRKLVDWEDGMLRVDHVRTGRHFYTYRHEENAKQNRTNFLKYMHKIAMAQDELRHLLEAQREEASMTQSETDLNYYAPTKRLQELLSQEWFSIHCANQRYDEQWALAFVEALMASPHRDYIATEWARKNRRDYIRGCVVGLLREGGVLKGSMDSIARSVGACDNFRTFSKYMGQSREEPYARWALDYINQAP